MSLPRFVLFGLTVLVGCGKETPAPVFTSPDGNWTYATPDKAISVDFVLGSTPTGSLEVLSQSIVVGNTPGLAVSQITNVNLPAIGMIRVNANDAGLVQPYSITFNNCTISGDLKIIHVASAEYTYPWGALKTLSDINIPRKP